MQQLIQPLGKNLTSKIINHANVATLKSHKKNLPLFFALDEETNDIIQGARTLQELGEGIKSHVELGALGNNLLQGDKQKLVLLLGQPQIAGSKMPVVHGTAAEYGYRICPITNDTLKERGLSSSQLTLLLNQERIFALNVTSPFKEKIFQTIKNNNPSLLEESALSSGALNLLKKNEQGEFIGTNSDVYGLINPLEKLGVDENTHLGIIGSGGSALSTIAAGKKLGVKSVTLYIRNTDNSGNPVTGKFEKKKNALKEKLTGLHGDSIKVSFQQYNPGVDTSFIKIHIPSTQGKEVIVNMTRLGFKKGVNNSIIPSNEIKELDGRGIVGYMDANYTAGKGDTPTATDFRNNNFNTQNGQNMSEVSTSGALTFLTPNITRKKINKVKATFYSAT